MNTTISAIVIARDEEAMIANCLETLTWCTEVVVIDCGSSDRTREIATLHGAKVISFSAPSFARLRQEGMHRATSDWLFYIDADERVTPTLAREITVNVEVATAHAFSLTRRNMMYGKFFQHGHWQDEVVVRVFRRSHLKDWVGDIHESPVFEGTPTLLHTPLIHFTHRSTAEGLKKSISWTAIEARLLHEAHTPRVTFATILRKGIMEFLRRGIFWQGWRDGDEGWIEALIQGVNKLLVYIRLWELQRRPSLEDEYSSKEKELADLWKKNQAKELSKV